MDGALTGHQRIDQRSIALHRAIADKLLANPALIHIARENLDRWSQQPGRSQPYFDLWRAMLDLPIEDLGARIVEDTEEMRALRQSAPFAGILSPSERWAIYSRFE